MKLSENQKLIVVGGPTCSGKTKFAAELARKINGELINADSRQIYKYLDVGTNKGEIQELNGKYFIDGIKINLISFLEPREIYSIYQFQKDARLLIEKIHVEEKQPILVGGSGLYIDAVIKNYELSETETDFEKRNELEKLSLDELVEMFNKIAPGSYENLNESDAKNKRRIIRLIERGGLNAESAESQDLKYNVEFYYPEFNWEELKNKIDNRVVEMFNGEPNIISETKKVLEMGFSKDCPPLKGVGYKDVIKYLNHEIDITTCIANVQKGYRQYARRQRTWFEGEGRNYNFIKF